MANMSAERRQDILDSHRSFMSGEFGQFFAAALAEKVEYEQGRLLKAKTWEEFNAFRASYDALDRVYKMLMFPDQFFD